MLGGTFIQKMAKAVKNWKSLPEIAKCVHNLEKSPISLPEAETSGKLSIGIWQIWQNVASMQWKCLWRWCCTLCTELSFVLPPTNYIGPFKIYSGTVSNKEILAQCVLRYSAKHWRRRWKVCRRRERKNSKFSEKAKIPTILQVCLLASISFEQKKEENSWKSRQIFQRS